MLLKFCCAQDCIGYAAIFVINKKIRLKFDEVVTFLKDLYTDIAIVVAFNRPHKDKIIVLLHDLATVTNA